MPGTYNIYESVLCEELNAQVQALCAMLPAEQVGLFDELSLSRIICKDYVEEWVEARKNKAEMKKLWDAARNENRLPESSRAEIRDRYELARSYYDETVKRLRHAYRDVKELANGAATVHAKMRDTISQTTFALFLHNVMELCQERFGGTIDFASFEQDLRTACCIDGEFQSNIEPQYAQMILSVPSSPDEEVRRIGKR